MATVESFRRLLKSMILCSKTVGLEMWTKPGKFVPASYYLSLQMIVYLVSTFCTLRKYRDDIIHMMKVLITLGMAVQLYIKFFIGHTKAKEIKQLSEQIEQDFVQRYQNGTAAETAVLHRTGRILWIVFRFITLTMICNCICFLLYPLFAYYVKGVVLPLFLYELPYYDIDTPIGYTVNMLFQVNLILIGTMGAILADFLYFMNAMYAIAMADMLIVHLDELEVLLNNTTKQDQEKYTIRDKWVQCMRDHQQTTYFLNTVEDTFGLVCLAQVTFSVFSICDGLLLVVLTDWYPVYCFLAAAFFELSMYFVIGNFVELKTDELYGRITSLPWYKLPLKEQKEFIVLMNRQQRPMGLTAYGFILMNYEAYMSVLKGLYQFFVMILQYVSRN